MAGGTLVLTRDQLVALCTDNNGKLDQDMLRKFELAFLGIDDLPNLQDGIDDNTLSIATLSDLVRPITVDLIQPLSAQIGIDTTYTLTAAQATEGMKTILIPSAFLLASGGGPYILTITTGVGAATTVPISPAANTITSGDLMFDIHVDASGNIQSKGWDISGSDGSANYNMNSGGSMTASIRSALGIVSQTWTYPVMFVSTPRLSSIAASGASRFVTFDPGTTGNTSATTLGWNDAGAASATDRDLIAIGRWRT